MKAIDYLKSAVEESRCSVQTGSSPFGAVIVRNGEIIARAHNMVVPHNDPTAHAEVMCIREACQKLGTFDLSGCELYSSCEPCPMCLNAAKWANIEKIYYAATRDDADSIGFRDKIFYEERVIDTIHIPLSEAREIMEQWQQNIHKKPY